MEYKEFLTWLHDRLSKDHGENLMADHMIRLRSIITTTPETLALPGGDQTITRGDAIQQGLGKYFTGKECSKGHLASRYVGNGGCVECQKIMIEQRKTKTTDGWTTLPHTRIHKDDLAAIVSVIETFNQQRRV